MGTLTKLAISKVQKFDPFLSTKLFQKRGTIQGGHYSRGEGALFKEIRYVVSD